MNKTFLNGVQTIQMYQKIPEVQYLFSLKVLKLLEDNKLEELDHILGTVLELCSDPFVENVEPEEESTDENADVVEPESL